MVYTPPVGMPFIIPYAFSPNPATPSNPPRPLLWLLMPELYADDCELSIPPNP